MARRRLYEILEDICLIIKLAIIEIIVVIVYALPGSAPRLSRIFNDSLES